MTLSDHLGQPFVGQVLRHGGRWREIEPGIHMVEGLPFRLVCMEARIVGERPGSHLLHLFSKHFLQNPRGILARLSEIYGAIARKHPDQILRIFLRDTTGDDASSERYQKAFDGLPQDRWQVFREAGDLTEFDLPLERKPEESPDNGLDE
jgi:hypothetical protein